MNTTKTTYPASDAREILDTDMVMIVRQEIVMAIIEDIDRIAEEGDREFVREIWNGIAEDQYLLIPDALMDRVRTIYDAVTAPVPWQKRSGAG